MDDKRLRRTGRWAGKAGRAGGLTPTVPFDMMVLNDLDRFHLAGDVIDRVPRPGSRAAYAKQLLRDRLPDHKAHVEKHGEDLPEILN